MKLIKFNKATQSESNIIISCDFCRAYESVSKIMVELLNEVESKLKTAQEYLYESIIKNGKLSISYFEFLKKENGQEIADSYQLQPQESLEIDLFLSKNQYDLNSTADEFLRLCKENFKKCLANSQEKGGEPLPNKNYNELFD
jgi:hypothetical protein